jgi:hypothetical protein
MNGCLAPSRKPSSRRPRTLLYMLCIRSNSMQLRLRRNIRTYSIRHNMFLVPISVPRMTLLSSATRSNWIIHSPLQAPIEPALQCWLLSLSRMSFDFRMAPHATSPCTSAPRSRILSFRRSISRRWTLQTVSSMGIASLISQDVVGFYFRIPTHVMPHSSTCRKATTCTLLLVTLPSLPDPSFLGSPRSRSCFQNCGINALVTPAPRNSVLLSRTQQVSRPILQLGFTRCTRARPAMMERFSVILWALRRTRRRSSQLPAFIYTLASYEPRHMILLSPKVPMSLLLMSETTHTCS